MGKSRSNKRSSSTSYTSTITTIVFIAVCVLGVWMLNSNSVAPPETTSSIARTARDTSTTKSIGQKDASSYEDNPGDLPDDAIKPDDGNSNNKPQEDQKTNNLEVSNDDPDQNKQKESEAQISEESTLTAKQQAEQTTQTEDISTMTRNQHNPENEHSSSESEEAQKIIANSNSEESEGNKKVEEQNTDSGENQEKSIIQQLVENNKEAQKDEEEQNKNQLQEDKGEIPKDTQQPQLQQEHNEPQQEEEQHQQKLEEHSDNGSNYNDETKPYQTSKASQDETHQMEEPKISTKASDNQQNQQKTELENQDAQKQETAQKETNGEDKATGLHTGESLENSDIPKESKESKKSWKTQADQSDNEKERRKDESGGGESIYGYTWQLCNVTAGPDFIPCLDNEKAIRKLKTTKHFQHRERHCPEEPPTCLVPFPEGYKKPIQWPQSRDKIWYHNVPHTLLAEVKGHQNWVKVTGEFLTFPGGGTQFIHGALHYIDFLQQSVPAIAWGKHTRVILDVGCGVASFGGFLFDRDVLAISFAPKDEHEAQVQFALERGIPAISAVMGSQRLPFPSRVFDLIHCARCRVPWHEEGGLLLLELNRVLRPGGYFVWSATPVYQKLKEDVDIWKGMSSLTASMCWELVTTNKDKLNHIGAAIYRKPTSNECYDQRRQKRPPMCKTDDDPNAAWYVPLQTCMHRVPVGAAERGNKWPEAWPHRLQSPPYWLNSSQMGIYGKPAPQDFAADYEHWKRVVDKYYMSSMGITWSDVRNVMDMRAVYGGFAAALRDHPVWVMNVVNTDSPDTLPIIYERGLFGIYHDWCESFSTYPRTYDLLHADHLFSKLKKRCKLVPVMAEVDRIVRPGGKLIVRDESSTIGEVENLLKSLRWEVHLTFSKNQEGMLSAQKGEWRPDTYTDA
ncbi:S-adenosyl-L-methionine-dependent methyltransferases superfamily protein [Quillaja saponaria]|uniref:S-adenosyl-L-methionine-dependent methyltransferases superfamily protein n=1 Tax=Quillaja saponaria TaxID=32244 RepID=A0AAD7L7I7_QUISA|nr:S-adenosyl-L-methionine-dependent methyltransferases superfamily protein [Quillaja saponaria]